MSVTPVFPLRLRNERLRELAKLVAKQESISQNELIEQALEHELVARGAMWASDLRQAADRLDQLTAAGQGELIKRSLTAFAAGEGRPEPLRARQITRPAVPAEAAPPTTDDPLGVVAAFTGR